MPFQPGRKKTGGRQKGGPVRKSNRFVDQLSSAGFNYVKELAAVLKEIKELRGAVSDPVRVAELKFFYTELKSLLPYMAPKLKEKEVQVVENMETPESTSPISTDDLLGALGHVKDEARDKFNAKPTVLLDPPRSAEGSEQPLAGEEPDEGN